MADATSLGGVASLCGVEFVDYMTGSAHEKAHTLAVRVPPLYVACTRAESILAVSSYVAVRDSWDRTLGAGTACIPKRFRS